jgi:hypothetical protein
MLGDLVHDTGGSSGAASCASTTLSWLGRLKWGLIAGSIDRLCQRPTTNARGRWSGNWGRNGAQRWSPYMLVRLPHGTAYIHASPDMRAAQQEVAKDGVVNYRN